MPDWRKNVQNILDEHVKRGVVGVSLAISMPKTDITHFTSGLSDKFKKLPLRPEHLFRNRELYQDLHRDWTSSAYRGW